MRLLEKLVEWFPVTFEKYRVISFCYSLGDQVYFREDVRTYTVTAQRYTFYITGPVIQYQLVRRTTSRFWADEYELSFVKERNDANL